MIGKRRLRKETLGILTETRTAIAVPKDAIIEIPVAPPTGARMVDVIWDGYSVMMFVSDLQERSSEVLTRRTASAPN